MIILALAFAAVSAVPNPSGPIPIPYPLFVNGHPFAQASMINGKLVVSADDLSRALGTNISIQGVRLIARPGFRPGRQKPGTSRLTREMTLPTEVVNRKNYVSLADLARAFGGTLSVNAAALRPGQTINLTFAPDPGAVLMINP